MISSGYLLHTISRCHSHFLPEVLRPTSCSKYNQCRRKIQIGHSALYLSSAATVSNAMENSGRMNNLKFQNIEKNKKTQNMTFNKKSLRKEFKLLPQTDPDTFGNLRRNISRVEETEDEGDVEEEKFLQEGHSKRKLSTKQYATIIKEFFSQKKVADAIDVLETRMVKLDNKKPENYIYNLIIGECGRLGYSKKAFQLYNQMKKRDLKVTGATYTGLFNACANSPWPEDGLERAKHLRELIIEKGEELNASNYHAMIKAFGRCGDLSTAFSLVDEMRDKKLVISDETLNFLIHACITDKEAGFRHALLVWQKMRKNRVKPDIFTYNLLLRSIRDCGLGDLEVAHDVIRQIVEGNPASETKAKLLLQARDESSTISLEDRNAEEQLMNDENVTDESKADLVTVVPENRPNLIARQPHLGNVIGLTEVTKPEDRLLLVGGCSGFLEQMKKDRVKPNIKTFTQLLDNIPSTKAAEKALLSAMKQEDIVPDIDFFNMLIKKRSMRFDYLSAREVLKLVQIAKVQPDVVTFGVLALGCKTYEEAQQLMTDMKNAGYRINAEILGAMLRQGCCTWNFRYVLAIMEIMIEEQVRPNEKFLQHLENFHKQCLKKIKYKNPDLPNGVSSNDFRNGFKLFSTRYNSWLKEVVPEKTGHPWEQFRKKEELPRQDSRSKLKNSS